MSNEVQELLEELRECKDFLDEKEAELSQAVMNRNDIRSEYVELLEKLADLDYEAYKNLKDNE